MTTERLINVNKGDAAVGEYEKLTVKNRLRESTFNDLDLDDAVEDDH